MQQPLRFIAPIDTLVDGNIEHMRVFRDFVEDMERTLCVQTLQMSVSDLWKIRPPAEVKRVPLAEFLDEEVYHIQISMFV